MAFDPISLTLTAASLALTAFGTREQTQASRESARAQRAITGLELQVEEQRKKAMELDARRRKLEFIRQGQRARAMSLTTATAQGAQAGPFGASSVLMGAYGQAAGQTRSNIAGVEDNLAIGETIFGLNQQIGQQRMSLADAGTRSSTGAGLSSLGGALMQNTPQLTNTFRSLGSLFNA